MERYESVVWAARTYIGMTVHYVCQVDLEWCRWLSPTMNPEVKTIFINTCDAMIHARWRGETFGLACGEFSIRNKPVYSYFHSPERAHIDILGTRGVYYSNEEEALALFLTASTDLRKEDWNCYSADYNRETVMQRFAQVFLS